MNETLPTVIREDAVPPNPLALAIAKGAGIETIERLVALQERMDAERARREFLAAFTALQAAMPPIIRTAEVTFNQTRYKFATLGQIARKVAEPLKAHGFSYRFEIADSGAALSVACIVSHVGGHSERTTMTAPADASGSKNAIQARGSAVSYLQRYTLLAALGCVTAQDDNDATTVAAVTPSQLKALRDGIADGLADERKLLAFGGCERLEDFPASKYGEAFAIMRRKAEAKR